MEGREKRGVRGVEVRKRGGEGGVEGQKENDSVFLLSAEMRETDFSRGN